MHRIDSTTAQVNKFGTGKNGFTEGDPVAGTPASQLTGAFFDAVQEELANAIEDFVPLNKPDNTQLRFMLRSFQRAFATSLQQSLTSGSADNLLCIASDGAGDLPRWVIGTSTGVILTSKGGLLWSSEGASPLTVILAMAWGPTPGKWVALAGAAAIYSTDGLTWVSATGFGMSAGDTFAAVAASSVTTGQQFVAVGVASGGAGVVLAGTDGNTWTRRLPAGAGGLKGVCFGAGKFVAVGDGGGTTTSVDGDTWTAASGVGAGISLRAVSYSARDGLYVAVGLAGALFTSSDGVTWTNRTIAGGPDFTSIAADPYGGCVAVGAAREFVSDNGTSWRERPIIGTQNLLGIAFANGAWIAVGNAGSLLTGTRF